MNNYDKTRKIVAFILILIGAVIILAIYLIAVSVKNENEKVINNSNYQLQNDGSQINTSEKVTGLKEIGDVVIEKTNLVYSNFETTLTSLVTNNGSQISNLRFKIKFIDDNGNILEETIGYVGKIATNETRTIVSKITTNVSNAKDIIYEVII